MNYPNNNPNLITLGVVKQEPSTKKHKPPFSHNFMQERGILSKPNQSNHYWTQRTEKPFARSPCTAGDTVPTVKYNPYALDEDEVLLQ